MEMQISMSEQDINAAVREKLLAKVPFIPENFEVSYVNGRGTNGLTATVTFEMDGTVSTVKPKTSSGSVSVRSTPRTTTAPEPEMGEQIDPEPEATSSEEEADAPFEEDASTAEVEQKVEEESTPKAAAVRKSLFGSD